MSVVKETFLFTPPSIANCSLWLDGSDTSTLTRSGATVTAWRDKTTNGNNIATSGTVTYSPDNKYVITDGTSSFFTVPVNAKKSVNPNFNVFMVYKWLGQAAGTNQTLWGNDLGGGWNRFQVLSFPGDASLAYGLTYTSVSPYVVTVSNLNTANTIIYSAQYSLNVSNGSFAYVNGTLSATLTEGAASSETTSTQTYFGQLGSSQFYANVGFNEILIYTGQMTTYQRQQVEGYFAWKWGLQGNLPSSHPFKNYRPVDGLTATIPSSYTNPKKAVNFDQFLPTQIAGCQLWLDASDTVNTRFSGSTLVEWKDKSLTGKTLTITGTLTRTSNGRNGLQTLTTNGGYVTTSLSSAIGNGNYALIAVWYQSDAGTNSVMGVGINTIGNGAGIGVSGLVGDFYKYNFYQFGVGESSYQIYGPTFLIQEGIRVGGTNVVYINGNAGGNATNTLNLTNTTVTVGAGTSFTINGQICEAILYVGTLTAAQRQQIEGYLAWKWGLTNDLPIDHPYRVPIVPFLPAPIPRKQTLKYFSPFTITGAAVACWMDTIDTSSLTLNSANRASVWRDKSTNRYSMVPLTGNTGALYEKSFNGNLPCLVASGSNIMGNTRTVAATTVQGATGITYFLVGQFTSGFGLVQFEQTGVGGTRIVDIESTGTNIRVDYNSTATLTSFAFNVPFLFSVSYNTSAGALYYYYNGGSRNSVSLSVASLAYSSGWGFFGQNSGTNGDYPSSGKIAEFLNYDGALTDPQIRAIEGYLAWKWRLQANLPSTHPYKLFPPSP